MNKINFANGSQPAINDTNLNTLQDNVENAINTLQDNVENKINTLSGTITLKELWRGSIGVTSNTTKTIENLDLSEYDITVYRVRGDYNHYASVVRVNETSDLPYAFSIISSDSYNAHGTVKYLNSAKKIEFKGEQIKGWDTVSIERVWGIKINKDTTAVTSDTVS